MATPGRDLDLDTRNQIVRLLAVRRSRRAIAHLCRVAKRTVDKIASEERAAAESKAAPAGQRP